MKTKKPTVKAIIALLFAGALFYSCSMHDADKTGNVIITFPGSSSARTLSADFLNSLSYRIVCTGPGASVTRTASPGSTVSITLTPGEWSITVTVFGGSDNRELGSDTRTATVEIGRNTHVNFLISINLDDNSGYIGGTLHLSGQVYTFDEEDFDFIQFIPNPGSATGIGGPATGSNNLIVNSNLGVTGTISANGILDFTIGTPDQSLLMPLAEVLRSINLPYSISNIPSSNVRAAALFLELDDETGINREIFDFDAETGIISGEGVLYLFVTADVTVELSPNAAGDSPPGGRPTGNTSSFSLNLRNGWNAIRFQYTENDDVLTFENISIGNPANLLWVISTTFADNIDIGPRQVQQMGPLAPNIWTEGHIFAIDIDHLYTINTTAGEQYYIWWNDSFQGDDTKTVDIQVHIVDPDGNILNPQHDDSAWDNPFIFTAVGDIYTIIVRVYPGYWLQAGNYGITYNTSNVRPPSP
jgi:hypothetical protein